MSHFQTSNLLAEQRDRRAKRAQARTDRGAAYVLMVIAGMLAIAWMIN